MTQPRVHPNEVEDPMTLSPEGARLLRAARDQILDHPEAFAMADWDCGTHACIAGWMGRVDPTIEADIFQTKVISERCGFGRRAVTPQGHPLGPLFYETAAMSDQGVDGALTAAERIDAFLWSFGYPPDDVAGESHHACDAADPCLTARDAGSTAHPDDRPVRGVHPRP
jgi:hypothetical protein